MESALSPTLIGAAIPSCLAIMPDWNYTVRPYRPRAEILNATWKFAEAQAMQ
jgi:hypothetical protein